MSENLLRAIHAHALAMSSIESRVLDHGETLVGLGFRCWLAGYREGRVDCWQHCWDLFCRELGGSNAQLAVRELSNRVNAVRYTGLREIELLPVGCRCFCRDECLAVTPAHEAPSLRHRTIGVINLM